jgi:hypothetical protein
MKARIISLSLACCAVLFMTGADFMGAGKRMPVTTSFCSGYMVIEAGKGIDCNGDTILLVKRKGYYEKIYVETPSLAEGVAAN